MADSTTAELALLPSPSQHNFSRPASWSHSLKRYVQETDISSLNLTSSKLKISEVLSILEFLADSQVTELDLTDNNFKNHMESFSKLLIQTKIKKLNVKSCHLKHDDVLSLMKTLKETQLTDLDISKNMFDVYGEDFRTFISCLSQSNLTVLNVADLFFLSRDEEVLPFIDALRNTSLTHLNLKNVFSPSKNPNQLLSLFFELKNMSITHLNLASCSIGDCDLKRLGDSVRHSKLLELDLSCNRIWDRNVDALFQALIGSKIIVLNLAYNCIAGENNLGRFLKQTQITCLDLSNNRIRKTNMFSFPDFLKGSSVQSLKLSGCLLPDTIGMQLMRSLSFSKLTELDVSENLFEFISIGAFAEIIKDTSITNFNVSENFLYHHADSIGGLMLIGELSKCSKLQNLDVSYGFHALRNDHLTIAAFLEKMRNSPVTSLNMSSFAFVLGKTGAEMISPFLASTQFTHLNLECNDIGDGVVSLAANLKFTAITHLNLAENDISDKGAKVLAECLMETRIVDLNLSRNRITCRGALALALFLKDAQVFSLKLTKNKIGNEGLKALAEHIQPNLITNLEVSKNPGNIFVVEAVIWNNRRLVRQLVSFFKRIAPETIDSPFRFEDLARIADIDIFLKECLSFYKLVTERSSTASILAEECVPFSKDQINALLLDEFPKQFTLFIASKVEADVTDHVKLLRRAEELGLHTIVEHLLLNRPVFTIDESLGILHPYVYELLSKYKLPICNLDVEPQGIKRISDYFTTFSNVEGAADTVRILRNISFS